MERIFRAAHDGKDHERPVTPDLEIVPTTPERGPSDNQSPSISDLDELRRKIDDDEFDPPPPMRVPFSREIQ